MSPILYRMIADGSETCEGPTGYGDGIGGYPIGQYGYGKKNITSDKLSSYLMKDPFDEDLDKDLLMEKKVSGTGETNEWNNKGTSPNGSDTGIIGNNIGNKMKRASNYAGITAGITAGICTKNIFGEAFASSTLPNIINRTQSNGSWDGFDDASKDYDQYDLDQSSTRARKNSKNIRHLDIEFETLNEREEREKQEATISNDICNYVGFSIDIFDYVGELAWYATKKCLKMSLLCFLLALVWESSSDLIEPLLWRGLNSFSPLLAWKLARALDGNGPITVAPSQFIRRRQLDPLEDELINHHLAHVASLEAEKKHKEEQLKSLDALIQADIKEGKIVIPNDQGDVQNNTQNNKGDDVQNDKSDVQNDKDDVQNDKGDNTQNKKMTEFDESQNESQMGFLDEVTSSTHKFNLEPVSNIIRNTTPTHGTEPAGF